MKIVALIPARRGSKRLPGKNIRMLSDKPLIEWTINIAKDIPEIFDILVSTDDPEVESICSKNGIDIPWLRPRKLATDSSSLVDVAIHALNWYESKKGLVDGLLLLQPTSPFRTKETIIKGIQLFVKNKKKSVVAVSPTSVHPMWMFKNSGGEIVPYLENHGLNLRSQDLSPVYHVNGSFYLTSPEQLRQTRSFYGERVMPLIMISEIESIDIDTELDFMLAECAAQKK